MTDVPGPQVHYPWRYRPGDDFVVLVDADDTVFGVVQTTGAG